MHLRDIRMSGLRTWKWHFLLVLWILMLANPQQKVLGYFLGDIKAVLNGCEDHWTLQDIAAFPLLYRMTVCVNIRVVAPGPWIAFTYSSVHGLMPELGLEGDEGALYAWLLRVKHRFPLQLSPQDWHQVCLRRDVVRSSFSLEVDGVTVGHRMVIAKAIPSYGSLWLGCGQRGQPLGATPGQVELYLFRLWADLQQHEPCEDGPVIGWRSDYWGVTSANARQRDSTLLCAAAMSTVSTSPDPSSAVTCRSHQLCSNNNIYFWVPISVEKNEHIKSEKAIHRFMSSVFTCEGKLATTRSNFDIFCLRVKHLQVENVTCDINEDESISRCGVVLRLSPTVSACRLHQAALSALHQTSATLTGDVQRVGQNLCDPSSGGFVTCSSLSLEEMCQSHENLTLTCTILKPDHALSEPETSTSCTSEETHYCNCASFCSSENHFYAQQISVTGFGVDTAFLQNMTRIQACENAECVSALEVLKNQGFKLKSSDVLPSTAKIQMTAKEPSTTMDKSCTTESLHQHRMYVNCENSNQRFYSCMMILEMITPVKNCSVITALQTLLSNSGGINTKGPLSHIVVCGDPGKTINSMLTSNLTWFPSNLHASDVCEVDQTRLKCAANEYLAVLLSDTCPSQVTSVPPSTKTTVTSSTTMTITQEKTTQPIPTTQSTSTPTTTFSSTTTTMTTSAVPTTTEQSFSSTLHPTVAKITRNTEVTTKPSAIQSEPTIPTTTLSSTTLKMIYIQTVPPTTSTLLNSEKSATTTTYKASNPTTANTLMASTVDEKTTKNTSKAIPTTSVSGPLSVILDTTVSTANTNTISSTTASTRATSEDISKSNTTSTPSSNSIYSTTTRIITEKATTASTTVSYSEGSSYIININDNSTKVTEASSATASSFIESTTGNIVDTTGSGVTITTTVGSATDVNIVKRTTGLSTVYTAPADIVNTSTTKDTITSSATVHTTLIASLVGDTTEATSTTASIVVSSTTKTSISQPHTSSSNVTAGSKTSASATTNATLPTTASSLLSTLNLETTSETVSTKGPAQTTSNPLISAITDSEQSTTLSDTVAIQSSTQMQETTSIGLHSTTKGETTTNASNELISELTSIETTQVTTTSAPYSTSTQQKTAASTPEATSSMSSTITNSHSTQQSTTTTTRAETPAPFVTQTAVTKVTSPSTHISTSNGSLVSGQTTMETTSSPTHLATIATAVSSVTSSTIEKQSSTIANLSTTFQSSITEHSVTTSSNIPTMATSKDTGVSKTVNHTAPTSTVTSATTIPVSEMYFATTDHKMTTTSTLSPSTITPKYNVTLSVTATTSASTTTITPTTDLTTEYKQTMSTHSQTEYATTSMILNTTTANKDTTSIKPSTTTFKSTTAATQASTTASTTNITAYLTSSSTPNRTDLYSVETPSPTAITPTTVQITTSTKKPSVNFTTEVTIPMLSSQSTTTLTTSTISTAATLPITTAITSTYDRTTATSTTAIGVSGTTHQTAASLSTLRTDTGLIPTTTEHTTRSQQELEEEADNLLSLTENASQLNSSQVSMLVGQLESLLDGPTVSQAVGKKAINIISNVMGGDAQALSASANRLVRLVDGLGLKLEVTGENEILSAAFLVLAVQSVNGTEFSTTTINIFNTDNVQLNTRRAKSSGAPLGSVFLPSSLTERLSPEEQRQASRVQFTFYTKSSLFQDATLNNETLVSPVLSSSVSNLSITSLRDNIVFTIRNAKPIKTNHSTSCVFWDFSENGGDGGWNNLGCHVIGISPEDTTCSCSHLTSFAVLLDFSREGIADRQQAQVLTFITYIGCGISAVFLSITILTYLSFEKLLRDIPAKILVQLCISLLLLNLVFLADGWLALYKVDGLCISTAFFLHYFLLTSFTWAGLEALHMYLSIVRVFTSYLSKYMMKFSLMGWGIPLIVVVIIIAVDKNNYGLVSYGKYTDGTTDDFCWLHNDIAFYVGVVAYFLLIFTFSLIVFIVVMVQLARIKRQNPHNQSPNRGVLTDLRSISGLIILLGLTWGFALFAWGPLYLPFVYLFSIFNSLQGFFIFVFHCAVKENVQRQWRTYLCCGRLRLAENSDWSRTATHNNKHTSFTMMSSSAAHLASSSSSVISETNSSGSAYADSGISDSITSDVVLNEIHRRNMVLQGHL